MFKTNHFNPPYRPLGTCLVHVTPRQVERFAACLSAHRGTLHTTSGCVSGSAMCANPTQASQGAKRRCAATVRPLLLSGNTTRRGETSHSFCGSSSRSPTTRTPLTEMGNRPKTKRRTPRAPHHRRSSTGRSGRTTPRQDISSGVAPHRKSGRSPRR